MNAPQFTPNHSRQHSPCLVVLVSPTPAAAPLLQTPVAGWLEAFAAHPKIGDLEGLKRKYGAFADMSKGEQAAAAGASEAVLQVRSKTRHCASAAACLWLHTHPAGR